MRKVVDEVVDANTAVDNQNISGIGLRMKAARDVLGLTQDGLAKAVGGSKRGIQENEARNRVPGGEVVFGMVRLGINANWLLTGEGPMLLADLAPPKEKPAPPAINVDALVQAFCVTLQTAPKGETVQQSARKAVAFYQYCLDNGMITLEGEGSGNLQEAS